MQLQVKGKNLDVSDSIRSYAERKLAKLDKQLNEPTRVEVELAVERNPSVADEPGRRGDGLAEGAHAARARGVARHEGVDRRADREAPAPDQGRARQEGARRKRRQARARQAATRVASSAPEPPIAWASSAGASRCTSGSPARRGSTRPRRSRSTVAARRRRSRPAIHGLHRPRDVGRDRHRRGARDRRRRGALRRAPRRHAARRGGAGRVARAARGGGRAGARAAVPRARRPAGRRRSGRCRRGGSRCSSSRTAPGGDTIDVTHTVDGTTLSIDDARSFGSLPALEERGAREGAEYTVHAERLDGDLWEVRAARSSDRLGDWQVVVIGTSLGEWGGRRARRGRG